MKKIIIYGLGIMGEKVAHNLLKLQKEYEYSVVALMDKIRHDFFEGFMILYPEELKNIDFDAILITSNKYYDEIVNELVQFYGVQYNKIIQLRDLIKTEKYYCNICNRFVPFMLDDGIEEELFKKRNIIGGGKREDCICPLCNSRDRERWLQYVLAEKLNLYESEGSTLHFAPEYQIEKKIRENPKIKYVTADIEEGRADRVEDITCISYKNESFDYIICNHILEHIKEEKKAFSELRRCLKNSGQIIFSVPICYEIDTLEDNNIITEEERLKEYGQKDHVRLYGKDIEQRLLMNNFVVKHFRVNECLDSEQITKLSLIPDDTIWILSKE